MSKTKLAVLIFSVAIGVNAIAFLFSKKTFLIEEVKNVWLYELPQSASPLDAYSALDLGPYGGVIGTFLRVPQQFHLAKNAKWDSAQKILSLELVQNLTYADRSPIRASDWVQATVWLQTQFHEAFSSPEWRAWSEAEVSAPDDLTFSFRFKALSIGFDWQKFLKNVLTHPLSGVIHPQNLEALKKGEVVSRKWISSGPYRIQKWNPKDIILTSRDDFPIRMPSEFFRTLKFQHAPVKNPSCDFMQAKEGEASENQDHVVNATTQTLHVFWICRSWKDATSFCADENDRAAFSELMKNRGKTAIPRLLGKTVRYRIPLGSDSFRNEIRTQIEMGMKGSGGHAVETSFFFKPSSETDIELEFIAVPTEENATNTAKVLALASSRVGVRGVGKFRKLDEDLAGEIFSFPIAVQMKKMQGVVFERVFLQPDLAEKQLGL